MEKPLPTEKYLSITIKPETKKNSHISEFYEEFVI